MSEETQQPDPKTPDVIRSPKNTDRDLEAERAASRIDAPEVVRKPVVIDLQAETNESNRSPKHDRDFKS